MCRLVSITLVGITTALLAEMSGNALACYAGDIEDCSRLSLAPVVIEADSILVCVPTYFRFGEDANLVKLDSVEPIYDDAKSSGKPPGRLVVISPKHPSSMSPVMLDGRKQILFLKKKLVDDSFQARYELEKSDQVFDLCKPWQSALHLDFSATTLTKKLATEKYGIHDLNAIVDVVKKLARWRTEKASKEKAVRQLVALLKSTKGEAIYEENIPPILAHLGTKVVKLGDEFIIEKPAEPQAPASTTSPH